VTVRSSVLFMRTGKPSPRLLALWKAKATRTPLQASAVLVGADGEASRVFRSIWQAAFGSGAVLPRGTIANKDGTATDDFWDQFTIAVAAS
jgi:hypothetical protein